MNAALEVKSALITQNEFLLDLFKRKQDILKLVHSRCETIDNTLIDTWNKCGLADTELSLLAVGGFGRGELHPHSDVDILILTESELNDCFHSKLSQFIAYLWDAGLEIGHSVRTIEQSIECGRGDITIATSLLESRLLIGNESLYQELQILINSPDFWPAQAFYKAKHDEQKKRHDKASPFDLEPNVKSCPGGLRDIQNITWVAMRHFQAQNIEELVLQGFLQQQELNELVECRNFLWKLRFALHIIAKRDENRLLFDYQKDVALLMGYQDATQLAVEQMMKQYYKTIRKVMELNEMLLQLFYQASLKQHKSLEIRPINESYQRRGSFIEALDDAPFDDPVNIMTLFHTTLQYPSIKGIFATTLRALRQTRRTLTEPLMNHEACRKIFMSILKHPRCGSALSLMHKHNILSAYIPAWKKIEGQMQFDLFHAFTVDEHTHQLLKNIDRLYLPENKDEFPLASIVASQLPKQYLLTLAAIFHDIGKGRGGDHSLLGAQDALTFCHRHQLSQHDSRLVSWLVENHLIMSMTAQRRDISDPEVVAEFADKVRDSDHLNYLYCLTVADIRATNEKIWNSWKDSLLKDLFFATQRALSRGKEKPIDIRARVREHQAKARNTLLDNGVLEHDIDTLWQTFTADYFLRHTPEQVVWHTQAIIKHDATQPLVLISKHMSRGGTELFVYCENRPLLFSSVMAVLDNKNLTINDANIMTSKTNHVLDTFIILEHNGKTLNSASRIQSLQKALIKQLTLKTNPLPKFKKLSRKIRPFKVKTKVTFLPSSRNGTTMIELIALDSPGLLAKVGDVFYKCNVTIVGAKITTIGERVEDFFRVRNHQGGPLDQQHQQMLKKALIDALKKTK
ncbi:MAG: bifunctional uridylyltransferase/uridylyl-removing protein GlnD [Parashewanella sp.]